MAFAAFLLPMPSPSPAASLAHASLRRARPLLGTIVEIEICADRPYDDLHAAIDEAFASIEQVHALMSYHDAGSELSRLNRSASSTAQRVDPRTYAVLQAALQFAQISEGAFDPSVAPRLAALGVLPRLGGPVDEDATWRDVELRDGELVRFLKPLRLDLGGIAKGFAVDEAVETLRRLEIDEILINAGGDLRIAGHQQRGIMLRDPTAPMRGGHRVSLQNAALATSAAYFSRSKFHNREISALIDGRSREPYAGASSVSVRAKTCMAADALTKVVLFADPATAEHCLARFAANAYLLVTP
jgi:thiamine biosynthesis lipoprotein